MEGGRAYVPNEEGTSIPGVGRHVMGKPRWIERQGISHRPFNALGVKNPPANAGDLGLIPGLGRSPEAGNGNPPQYSFQK